VTKAEVRKAIEFKRPSEVPLKTEDIAPGTFEKYGDKLWQLLRLYPNDFVVPSYEPPIAWTPTRPGEDEWGCVWEHIDGQTGAQVKVHPLSNWDQLESYKFPDPTLDERFRGLRNCLRVPVDLYTLGSVAGGLFIQSVYLRGFERFLEDLYLERDRVEALLDRVMEYDLALIDKWRENLADCIFILDDIGSSRALLINPQLWRELFKPRYAGLIDRAHRLGMPVWYHTCGHVEPILGDLIDIGLDIIHNVQLSCNDISKIGSEYRGKICFSTGPDELGLFKTGSAREVYDNMCWIIDTLGTDDGGFIAANEGTIFPDIPFDNMDALFRAAKGRGL